MSSRYQAAMTRSNPGRIGGPKDIFNRALAANRAPRTGRRGEVLTYQSRPHWWRTRKRDAIRRSRRSTLHCGQHRCADKPHRSPSVSTLRRTLVGPIAFALLGVVAARAQAIDATSSPRPPACDRIVGPSDLPTSTGPPARYKIISRSKKQGATTTYGCLLQRTKDANHPEGGVLLQVLLVSPPTPADVFAGGFTAGTTQVELLGNTGWVRCRNGAEEPCTSAYVYVQGRRFGVEVQDELRTGSNDEEYLQMVAMRVLNRLHD